MKYDFVLILMNFFIFSSNDIIKLPFYKQISNNFISNYLNIELNTNLMIGNPYQKIEMTLSLFTNSFILKGLLFNSEFNEKKSNKFIKYNKSGYIFYDQELFNIEYCSDNILFENYINTNLKNNISIESFKFQLLNDTSMKEKFKTGIIGLDNNIIRDMNDESFIEQLFNKLIIKKKVFFLNYENYTFGKIIFGNLPHLIDNKPYTEKYYVKVKKDYFSTWTLSFKHLYIGNQKFNGSVGEFNFHFKGLIFDKPIKKQLDDIFFNKYKYFEKKICVEYKYEVLKRNILVYKCSESLNIKNFPKIQLYHYSLNYTFEFDGNELFIKDEFEKQYVFLISFIEKQSRWYLGEIFLRKYMTIFNEEEQYIGFYIHPNEKSNFFNFSKTILIIFVFIIMMCIIIILSYYLWKAHKNKRKIRANELEDNYEYF